MASASRRARNLPNPVADSAVSVAMAPLVCTPSRATPPVSGACGGGRRREPGPKSGGRLAPNEERFDKHGDDKKKAKENQHSARGQRELGAHRNAFTVDNDSARDRPAFTQHFVDQDDDRSAEARSDHTPAPAKDRRATNDDGCNNGEFPADPIERVTPLSCAADSRAATVAQSDESRYARMRTQRVRMPA